MLTPEPESTPGIDLLKARIFISYSRRDMAFANQLEAALKVRGFEPLIDRTEIYAFEDWWERIEALIGRSDTVVFVLSPDAVASDVALKEVAHAASLNKRLAPIVCRSIEDGAVPEELRRLNFIFFDDPSRFEVSADLLAEALQTDIGWIRQHTEFGEAARRWSVTGRPSGLLLRSPALEDAERWIASRPRGAPEATEETQAFLAESRRGASRRRNILTGSLMAGLLGALALAGLAYWQRGIAVEQQRVAQEQRNIAETRHIATLAELATVERLRGNPHGALRLGTHAARLDLLHDKNAVTARAALAVTVTQSDWRLMLAGHEDSVLSAAFSPDGSRIVTASADKTARIWDAATGKGIMVLRGHDEIVNSAAFSPDGSRIVTASDDKTARIWDVATGKEITVLRGHEGTVSSAAFSPDGARIVTASWDGTARIGDAATGKALMVMRGHAGTVRSAAFSPDGSRIVTASDDDTARIWDAATGKEIMVLRGHDAIVNSAAFSPDGSRIVTAVSQRMRQAIKQDHTARIWDAATGKEINVLRGHENPVLSAAFSPHGSRIVTASQDKTARIWDAATGSEIMVLHGHDIDVNSAAFSPDGARIVTASWDGTARIWDAATGKDITVLRGHDGIVSSAAFSPDGSRIVTASEASSLPPDTTARIWDATTGKELAVLRGHENSLSSAAFSPDGARIVTASSDQTARIWGVSDGSVARASMGVKILSVTPDAVRARGLTVAAGALVTETLPNSPAVNAGIQGGDVITSMDDTPIRDAPELAQRIGSMAPGTLVKLDLIRQGREKTLTLVLGTLRVPVTTAQQITVLRGHEGTVGSAAFSPDGARIVTGSADGTARIWDAATGKEVTVLRGHESGVSSAAFSLDGARIVTASEDKTARIWDAGTGKEIMTLRGHEGAVYSAAFSRDGARIVTASDDKFAPDHTARIWDAATGKQITVLREGSGNSAAFNPDGARIVTGSADGTARIWDAATGKEIMVLRGHEGAVYSAAFSPDGARIVTASEDKTARIWDVHFATISAEDLVAEVCVRRMRGLTTLTRDEMRLAGYADDVPAIDVCAGVE
jgi:WD40 repeat protein